MLTPESQDLLHRGDAFTPKGIRRFHTRPKPAPCSQPAQLFERHPRNRAATVGGSVQRLVVQSHQTRVARELQVGFDKGGPQLHRLAKGCERILRSNPRSSAMPNYPPSITHTGTPVRSLS